MKNAGIVGGLRLGSELMQKGKDTKLPGGQFGVLEFLSGFH